MDLLQNIKERAIIRLRSIDYQQGLRLVIIVGGYMLLRRLAQRELAKRQLASQVQRDQERKQEKLIDRPEEEATTTSVAAEPETFGWGNKTRYRVKKQQELLGQAIDNLKKKQQHQAGYDSDEDIADLLED